MKKIKEIFLVALPILIMVGLIVVVKNDYALTLIYTVIILGIFSIKKEKEADMIVFWFGFVMMIIFEYIFISTGVETFLRITLFSIMPLWLPFLWGYGFVAIKNGVKILERK